MADVFLSYKREDQVTARVVSDALTAEGFSTFFDEDIPVGDAWDERIERELNAAKVVVVLWSPASRESRWVRTEARDALERRILCPAMIETCTVPIEFSDVQAADLRNWRGDTAASEWSRLIGAVRHTLDMAPQSKRASKVGRVRRVSPALALPILLLKGALAGGAGILLAMLLTGGFSADFSAEFSPVNAFGNMSAVDQAQPVVWGVLGMVVFAYAPPIWRWIVCLAAFAAGPAKEVSVTVYAASITQTDNIAVLMPSFLVIVFSIIATSVVLILCAVFANFLPRVR